MFKFFVERPESIKNDILAGITVALTVIPESLLFAFLSGAPASTGLITTGIMMLIAVIFGGRPGMIPGVSGTMTLLMVHIVSEHDYTYLVIAVAMMGLIQIGIGALKIGKYIRLVPKPVLMGFVNGMVITILIQQYHKLLEYTDGRSQWIDSHGIITILVIGIAAVIITNFWPKITKVVPGALIALIVCSAGTYFLSIDTPMIGALMQEDPTQSIKLFSPNWAQIEFSTIALVLPTAFTMAILGLTQSLMTMAFFDELSHTRGNGNDECMSQGVGNLLCAILGAPAGTALLGQSVINYKSGGRSYVSVLSGGATVLLIIFFFSQILDFIPVAAVGGIIIFMVLATFSFSSLKIIQKIQKTDAFVLIAVSAVTILSNVAIGVVFGIVFTAMVFAWENAIRIRVRKKITEAGVKHYEVYGPLFFGSADLFEEKFEVENDPQEVVINFQDARVWDHSGIEAILKVVEEYHEAGKDLKLIRLSRDTRFLLHRTGLDKHANVVTDENDPTYKVVTDYTKR